MIKWLNLTFAESTNGFTDWERARRSSETICRQAGKPSNWGIGEPSAGKDTGQSIQSY